MKIQNISKTTIFFIQTEEHYYTRYSNEDWTMRMGESDEPIYDNKLIEQLESQFQNWMNENTDIQ